MTTRSKAPEGEIVPRWLSFAQAGIYMGGRTPEAIRMLVRRGQLPYVQDGKRILIDRLDIDRKMEAAKVTPAV